MSHPENFPQEIHLQNFLATSRAYFALSDASGAARQARQHSKVNEKTKGKPMNTYRKIAQSLFMAAGLGALLAGPVLADSACGPMGPHQAHHAKMMEQHHKQLHDALSLTPQQEPAWVKLMESEQPMPALSGGQPDDWAKLNAPERAEKMLELSKKRQERMAEHVAALKAFYATLTPEQQKTFEGFHAGPRGGMRGQSAPKASNGEKAPAKP